MSRHTRPTYPLLSPVDDSGDGASGVEDSLRGTAAVGRHGAVATDLFGRPAGSNTYAFASTPDALPTLTLPPHHAVWHSPRGPHRASTAASSIDETPEAGPSNHFNLAPPRIERQAPTSRLQPHSLAPPHPVFAASSANAGVGGGHTLFTRPPTAPTAAGVNAFGSPTEMSLSNSFSFAPRAGAANAIFALPTARAHLSQFAAPHTPVPSARPTTATAAGDFYHATTPGSTNLDAAALAVERRIREARVASRGGEEVQVARRVSFSPVVSTPLNHGTGAAYSGGGGAPPPPPNRAGVGAAAGRIHADAGFDSISHLNRAPLHQRLPSGTDPNISLSVTSTFARPTATRLFPSSSSTVEPPTSSLFTSSSTTHPPAASEASASRSWTAENTSTCTSAAVEPPTIRLRKWDGSQTVVPAYLVSDSAEQVLEEQWFEYDTVQRFDAALVVERQLGGVAGTVADGEQEEEGLDSVKGVLEIQLGLKGLHGWYGHTFKNRHTDAVSRKRRRTSSPDGSSSDSPPSSANAEDEPIIVYDPFGRVRGHVVLPNYAVRGGPSFPLPSPRETFALRQQATAAHVLATTERLVAKEDTLCLAGGTGLRSDQVQKVVENRKALRKFQAQHRTQMLKGLQNALLDSVSHPRRRTP